MSLSQRWAGIEELTPCSAARSVAVVLDDDTGFSYIESLRYTGLQYVVCPLRIAAHSLAALC